jgi:ligand-binding sensor domain-containing protein
MTQSADGDTWIGTSKGLVKFDGLTFVSIRDNDARAVTKFPVWVCSPIRMINCGLQTTMLPSSATLLAASRVRCPFVRRRRLPAVWTLGRPAERQRR